MNQLIEMFSSLYGAAPSSIEPIKGSGSARQYSRLCSPEVSCIAVKGSDDLENKAFLALDRHFAAAGLPVPAILSVSEDGMRYLQEDLGRTSLYDIISSERKAGGFPVKLLEETIAMLPRIQFEGVRGLNFSVCYPEPSFGARMISFDLNYFKYCFLKPSGTNFNEISLQDDFEAFSNELMKYDCDAFMYRDFQSRNVMLKDGKPYFIDFQGGRRGPYCYDLASFVNQSSAAFPDSLKTHLVDLYYRKLQDYLQVSREEFDRSYALFSLFRNLQVLGAYGFRGLVERKEYFLKSIPAALRNLSALLENEIFAAFPYMRSILMDMCRRFTSSEAPEVCNLVVDVMSFSYRKGIPEDKYGNGGGYVFDCRGLHNPGRYEQYKSLTGKDKPVIDFLEQRGEIQPFLDHVYGILDPHIETYVRRGFEHLTVFFGCTGGQHRSVYSAEHFAAHIREKYPWVKVNLIHREQQ